jgi:hypothetical protein
MKMKLLKVAIAAAVVTGAVVPSVGAQQPYPAKQVEVGVYADTVSSSRGDVKLARVCTQTNNFPRKARVVFRAWAVDTKTGKPITPADVKYAYVAIPGQPSLKLNFGPHGAIGNKVNFWSAAWAIPPEYPLGVVSFRIVFKTFDNRFGIYRQPPIDSARLTVTP